MSSLKKLLIAAVGLVSLGLLVFAQNLALAIVFNCVMAMATSSLAPALAFAQPQAKQIDTQPITARAGLLFDQIVRHQRREQTMRSTLGQISGTDHLAQ